MRGILGRYPRASVARHFPIDPLEDRAVQDVEFASLSTDRFAGILGPERHDTFTEAMGRAASCFEGRTLWCVNSTAKGGGVAEMLQSLLGYLAGAGIDARWAVIDGDDEFFAVTKRIHNRLHGEEGDGGPLGSDERQAYERCLEPSGEELATRVRADDLVIVHDPQPAGLIPAITEVGAAVLWRCHIGVDRPNDVAREAWDFLRPFVSKADACVFSRRSYAWQGLDRVEVVPPSIDAFSPKNRELERTLVEAILGAAGVVGDRPSEAPRFERQDGTPGTVTSRARMMELEPVPPEAPLVLQVSRWDRLKDHVGVLNGFASHVPPSTGAHLILAGPNVEGVADDPEEQESLNEVREAWKELPEDVRRRAHLVCVPVEDDEENSIVVNALQRRADVVVQKSLAEGFGLTLAEAMWKERPVVASRVGGLQDQVVDGESGVLIEDPEDLEAFGRAVTELLQDGHRAGRMGKAARDRVCEEFLATRHLLRYVELLADLGGGQPGEPNPAAPRDARSA